MDTHSARSHGSSKLGVRFCSYTEHRHSGIRFVTPQQRHEGADNAILTARANVYEQAKAKHPNRWRGRAVRDWTPIEKVWLNPDRQSPAATKSERLAA